VPGRVPAAGKLPAAGAALAAHQMLAAAAAWQVGLGNPHQAVRGTRLQSGTPSVAHTEAVERHTARTAAAARMQVVEGRQQSQALAVRQGMSDTSDNPCCLASGNRAGALPSFCNSVITRVCFAGQWKAEPETRKAAI
jgi:hypothetical protein